MAEKAAVLSASFSGSYSVSADEKEKDESYNFDESLLLPL